MKKAKWTLDNVPDMTGKTIIITGANSGLGFESSKILSNAGADVIMACRSEEKGLAARKAILIENPGVKIKVMPLDLMSLDSVRQFADAFKKEYNKLDILINNAGIMMTPFQLTKDGFESQLGVNHLGHFALTGLLMDLIRSTPGARVINISSIAHKSGKMDVDDLMYKSENGYTPIKAYGRSKLANLLFTYELQRFFENNKIDALTLAAHPGVAMTNLMRYLGNKRVVSVLTTLSRWIIPSALKGAMPQIRAASDPKVKGGQFYGPGGFNEMSGSPVLVDSNELSKDKKLAKKLWEESERLTGMVFK